VTKKTSKKLKRHKFRFKKLLTKINLILTLSWAPLFLITTSLLLAFLNYQPDTWLTGWDNLHPEFFFKVNLKRSLFSVWQEYQGLGLLGGMAHAADLPRQLILYSLNLLGVPAQNLRYLWTFAMLTIGPLGVYFFIKNLSLKSNFDRHTKIFAALLGGLFYLLNLSTVQNFFVPFESFVSFFGFFPWLILVTTNYLQHSTKRHYLHLIFTYILATSAFYVETIFVVLVLCILPLILITKAKFLEKIKTISTILITQSFWLLPVIFFVLTNGHIGEQAKINLIATPETYLRNLEFANLKDIALLKGYLLNFTDLGLNQKFTYLFLPWRQHLENPLILSLGYLNFILILTGVYYTFQKKIKTNSTVISIGLISLFFLFGGGLLINQKIPLIGELFRSPFTKFSTPLSFTFAVLFSIGSIFILDLFSFLHHRLTHIFTLFTLTLSLFIFTSPAFSGQLISPNMRLKVPEEYFETFKFFEGQDPNTRIANFPQHTFWGWNFYSWGYRGSGFLWYGIKQPILDRAFDVWEKQNENYYQEINTAIYSNDQSSFEELVEKYSINWILVDKFVLAPQENQSLNTQELLSLLDASDHFKLEKNLNNKILIYKSNQSERVQNFISSPLDEKTRSFPFKNLSLRPNTQWTTKENSLTLTTKKDSSSSKQISFPSYTETEDLVPVEVSYKKLSNQILLKFSPLLPVFNSNSLASHPNYVYLDIPSFHSNLILRINDQYFELALPGELLTQPTFYPLTNIYLPTKDQVSLQAYTNSPTQSINVTNALKDQTPYQCYTDKKDRQIEKITFSDSISLIGTDVVGCLSLPLPSFIPPGLTSTQYTHFSPTGTPANTNITASDLSISTTPPQPLNAKSLPFTVRQFSPVTREKQQLNLILEANNTQTIKEITYQNITTNFHPLLASTSFILNPILHQYQDLEKDSLTLSLPLINSSFNILQTPQKNQLLSKAQNCSQLRSGLYAKEITSQEILYQSQDAITCDTLDLRHLPHTTSYLLQLDHQHLQGLPMTICLENHSTHRCDVFERLQNTSLTQSLIQPIRNQEESSGYTLHLYNQSFGQRLTRSSLKSITLTPLPLNFLKSITLTPKDQQDTPSSITINSTTHPAEFIYTASVTNKNKKEDSPLHLNQTNSPYWLALKVDQKVTTLSPTKLILKIPFLLLQNKTQKLEKDLNSDWNNSWQIPPGEHHLLLVYLPQYLEFFGIILLLTPLPLFLRNQIKKNKR
jgi:hypothetical protein